MLFQRKLFQRAYRIISLYEEYKLCYDKLDIIGIIPQLIIDLSSVNMAYTDNEELMDCVANKKDVTLYYSEKLFECTDEYIKAVLFHEFTHISDAYNFVGMEYSNSLMSTYSEFNAMQEEFKIKCRNRIKMLDEEICAEDGYTTPRKEIEGYIEDILSVSKIVKGYPDKLQDKMDTLVNTYLKSYSWMFAILSFYEKTEQEYFNSCFQKLDQYGYKVIAQQLYNDIQNVDAITKNPIVILSDIEDIFKACFD